MAGVLTKNKPDGSLTDDEINTLLEGVAEETTQVKKDDIREALPPDGRTGGPTSLTLEDLIAYEAMNPEEKAAYRRASLLSTGAFDKIT